MSSIESDTFFTKIKQGRIINQYIFHTQKNEEEKLTDCNIQSIFSHVQSEENKL